MLSYADFSQVFQPADLTKQWTIFGNNNKHNNNQLREISNICQSYQLLVHVSPWLRLITWRPRPTCPPGSGTGSGPIVNIFSSLPTRAGGASTLRITPSPHNINMVQTISHLQQSVIRRRRFGVSLSSNRNIYQRQQRLGWHTRYPFLPLPVYPRLQPRQWRIVLPLSSPCQEE